MYTCKECGIKVIVHDGKIHKICQCKAPVVCDMAGHAVGKGDMNHVAVQSK